MTNHKAGVRTKFRSSKKHRGTGWTKSAKRRSNANKKLPRGVLARDR